MGRSKPLPYGGTEREQNGLLPREKTPSGGGRCRRSRQREGWKAVADRRLMRGIMVCFIKRLPLTRELSAQLTEGEKNLDILQSGSFLSLRQNLRFCHLPRQREAIGSSVAQESFFTFYRSSVLGHMALYDRLGTAHSVHSGGGNAARVARALAAGIQSGDLGRERGVPQYAHRG